MNQEGLVRLSLLQHVVDPFLRKMDRQSFSTAGSIEKIYDNTSRVSMLGNLLPITQSAPTIRWDPSAIPWFYLNLRNRVRHTASTYSADSEPHIFHQDRHHILLPRPLDLFCSGIRAYNTHERFACSTV